MTDEPKSEGAVTHEKRELDPGALANLESLVRALVENLPFTLKHTAAAQVFGAYLAGLGGEYLAWLRLIHQASRVTAAEKRAETAERELERLESEADAFCEAAGGAVNTSAAIEWCKRMGAALHRAELHAIAEAVRAVCGLPDNPSAESECETVRTLAMAMKRLLESKGPR